MDEYSECSLVNGKKYKIWFIIRVKPDKIRYSNSKNDYWVLNGSSDEMRPYRIFIKKYKYN